MSTNFTIDADAGRSSSANLPFPAQPIRMLVVDDHGIVRDAITVMMERDRRARVVGTAPDGEQAVLAALRLKPDMIIMDLVLPILNGIDATRRIIRELPTTRIIVFSGCHAPAHVNAALRAGARGYVLKAAAHAELPAAVQTVIAGNRYVSPEITELFHDGVLSTSFPGSPFDVLSVREREVLRYVVAGSSSSAIALLLSLSCKTVDTYRQRMMTKLRVPNRSALIRLATQHTLPSA